MFIKPVQNDGRICACFQFYYNPHPFTVRFVPQTTNTLYFVLLCKFRYLFYQSTFVYLVRYLIYDYLLFFTLYFYLSLRPYPYAPSACFIRTFYALVASDNTASGEIRRFYYLHQLFYTHFGLLYYSYYTIYHFCQVVWRHICCHTYCDT